MSEENGVDNPARLVEKKTEEYELTASQRVVKAAAQLIQAEIREREYNSDPYLSHNDTSDLEVGFQLVPSLLQSLITELVSCQIKQLAIANSIIQAVRPKSVISPILFGVGVQMDHTYGSKWLLDQLARLGFCISSEEVYRFKQSIMHMEQAQGSSTGHYPSRFTQWTGDNVDQNVATLDGLGSFHGMGLIAVSTVLDSYQPGVKHQATECMKHETAQESVKSLGLPIKEYFVPELRPLSAVTVCQVRLLQEPIRLRESLRLNLLWSCGWIFRSLHVKHHGWSGFMQHVSNDENNGKSEVILLPIVDLNPSDNNPTLHYIASQAKLLNVVMPCITFD